MHHLIFFGMYDTIVISSTFKEANVEENTSFFLESSNGVSVLFLRSVHSIVTFFVIRNYANETDVKKLSVVTPLPELIMEATRSFTTL